MNSETCKRGLFKEEYTEPNLYKLLQKNLILKINTMYLLLSVKLYIFFFISLIENENVYSVFS